MKKAFNISIALIPVPAITFLFCTFLALLINNSYQIDPDYAYLFNGLNIARGESYSIVQIDHPGTPLQVLTGIFIIIIGTMRGVDDLTLDVVSNPQLYIKTIIIIIAIVCSMVLFFIGKRYYKYQKNLTNALLLQFSFLLFATATVTPFKLFTETILPLGSLLIILITIEKVWGKMNDLIYAILSGVILGIFIAIKITFLPVAVIPIILATRWRNKILVVALMGISFFISILPVIERFISYKSYIQKIATHDGFYGSGQEEIINISKLLHNLLKLLQTEYTFTLIFILSLVILILAFRKNKFRFLKDNNIRILFALFLSSVLLLLIVSKQVIFRYMIPTLLMSAFALSIIVSYVKSYKIVSYSIIILALSSALYYNFKMLSKAIRINQSENKTYSFIQHTITPDNALLVVTKEPWYGSPFITHSLMFGKSYCLKQGEQYNEVLERNYPKHFFWTHNTQQFAGWRMAVMPDLLLNENKKIYIYIQTDNPQLYSNTIDDFTRHLKYINQDSVDLKLVFSNPEMDEEIYLLSLKNPKTITPKLQIFSSFEKKAEEGKSLLLTNNDSILIDEGLRLTEQHAFEGKNSICIIPDNPYGISAIIPNVYQHDFIHISVMCKRSLNRNECCIGMKSFISDKGFVTLGGVSTEVINGWEKIEYSYRFNHMPAGQKIIMFIWNNSNEPMYFDNLKIELY
jgi:hypothetical protein